MMRALVVLAVVSGLVTGLPAAAAPQSDGPELVTSEAYRDVSPGSLLQRDSGEVQLFSEEDGAKLSATVGWRGAHLQFGLKATSELDEGEEEVELLNLDGVSGGATVTGQISYRFARPRKPLPDGSDHFSSVCRDYQELVRCNLILDRQGNSAGAARSVEDCICNDKRSLAPLSIIPEADCTPEAFADLGPPFDELADKAQEEALTAGCAELAKYTGEPVLPPASPALWPLATTQACDEAGILATAQRTLPTWTTSQLTKLRAEASKLNQEARRLHALAATISAADVKQAVSDRALEASASSIKALAEAETLQPPPFLSDPEAWLLAKEKELLKSVCTTYNSPPAEMFLQGGNSSECDADTLMARSEKLPKPQAAYIRRHLVQRSNWIPWIFTLESTVSRRSFSFVEPQDLDTKINVSNEDQRVGLFASTLYVGTFYSLGIETQRVHKAQPKVTLCRPLEGTDAEVCRDQILGGPEKSTEEVARVEVRRFLSASTALSVRGLWRLDPEDWEAHGLLYFLRSEKKGLNGGIDLSYDSKDEWNARVFIGNSFELLE